MNNLDWMSSANCLNEDPELFFPSSTGITGRRQAEDAERICKGCPVQRECRDHKQHTGASSGVWGGRKPIPKATSASQGGPHKKSVPHGTEAMAARHRRRGERPCRACLNAERRARKQRGGASEVTSKQRRLVTLSETGMVTA